MATSQASTETLGRWAASRSAYVDNLKALMIAAIIAGHGFESYSALEVWAYGDVRETTLSPVTEAVAYALVAPFGLFMIPLLFLVAGLLTPPSLRRKRFGPYTRDRLLRLGVPLAVFSLLVWPALLYALYRPLGNAGGSYWAELVGGREEALDTGYLWFVGDLLLFSLVYAAWVRWGRREPARVPRGDVTLGHLLLLAAVVAGTTFVVRLAFPFDSQRFVDLNIYQWPESIALFALGVVASGRGWLTGVPDRLRRRCRTATLAAVGGFAVFTAVGFATGVVTAEPTWRGGWYLEAFLFAALESALAVFGPVWLLGEAQRRLDRPLRWIGPAVQRSAYGAFLVQGLVLIGLAVALRPAALPAEVKGLAVAAGGIAGSFGLAMLVLRRVPGAARVL